MPYNASLDTTSSLVAIRIAHPKWIVAEVCGDEKSNDLSILAAMRRSELCRAGMRHVRLGGRFCKLTTARSSAGPVFSAQMHAYWAM